MAESICCAVLWILSYILSTSKSISSSPSTWCADPKVIPFTLRGRVTSPGKGSWFLSMQIAFCILYLDSREMVPCAKPAHQLGAEVWYPVGWYIHAGIQLLFSCLAPCKKPNFLLPKLCIWMHLKCERWCINLVFILLNRCSNQMWMIDY